MKVNMNVGTSIGHLHRLAHLYNIQTAYYDVARHRQQASIEGLLAVLRELGAPVKSLNDVSSALRERRQALWQRILEPVTVAWNGECPVIKICLPVSMADASLLGHLELEDSERKTWQWQAADLPVLESTDIEGARYVVKEIRLSDILPWGYHRFFLEIQGNTEEALIISAPVKTYLPSEGTEDRMWGTFLPLYALHSQNGWGSGDYSDLEALTDRVATMGGRVVATLPLLPVFLDEPFESSPYAPVSRLLWNEFYLDINKVPELAKCPRAQELLQSLPFQTEIRELRDSPLVGYRRLMSLKRRILEELGRCLLAETSDRSANFQRFIQANPVVEDYARFRAVMERQHASWHLWPWPLRDGTLREGDYDEGTKHYHTYAQWLAHQQVQHLAEGARSRGVTLYFDLPSGTHPDGYDTWRNREYFALDAASGAPPDAVFTCGQDWGFPPPHPERMREQGYRYFTAYIRHHLKQSGMLRIDHVMGLHRLFWIPKGMDACHGVYVRYRAEELYAILALESHRHRSVIVGEDLGMVPSYVRPAMSRHVLQRMYVLHYELADNSSLHRLPVNAVASLNTHDMPPFAAFWQGLDIEERLSMDLLDKKGAQVEKRARQACKNALAHFLQNKNLLKDDSADIRDILRACLLFLSISQARTVLVNLEDLWLETQSQNVPSTREEHPNWQKKARHTIEEFCRMPEVLDTLKAIDRLRKQGAK
ncbi:4-alpha-glucanotransferase [Chloroflexota bacterium]